MGRFAVDRVSAGRDPRLTAPDDSSLSLTAFNDAVRNFFSDIDRAVSGCFVSPDREVTAEHPAEPGRLRAVVDARVALVQPGSDPKAKGADLATLRVNYKLCTDAFSQWLAVEHSTFELKASIDRAPIIRWDYDRDAHSKPSSHVQVTAHRGALSHLLSQLGHPTPHSLESLHIPTGGARFRPCLEDVVEFLIADCGFSGKRGWRKVVREGRAKWRRIQTGVVVRDAPAVAADALRRLGYTVTPPEGGDPAESLHKLHGW